MINFEINELTRISTKVFLIHIIEATRTFVSFLIVFVFINVCISAAEIKCEKKREKK